MVLTTKPGDRAVSFVWVYPLACWTRGFES